MSKEEATLTEIVQRITRIECRIVNIGDSLGSDMRRKERQIAHMHDEHGAWIEVNAQDISFSTVRNWVSEHVLEHGAAMPVRCKGVTLGCVYV